MPEEDCPPASYFSGLAGVYAAHRPTYPGAAIDAILENLRTPVTAVDVGCGTGICSRLLARAGARVTGIDPNADMLQKATGQEPSPPLITYRRGSAERTGCADASVDLVVCAQAYHWFDGALALREFHRILRPRGRLALMWNVRLASTPMSAGYAEVVRIAQEDARRRGRRVPPHRTVDLRESTLFDDVRTVRFDNPQRLDGPHLLGRARSASYFPPPGPLREELEATLHRLFREHARDGQVRLEQVTEVVMATARR